MDLSGTAQEQMNAALLAVVKRGDLASVQEKLSHGADPEAVDEQGCSALHWAARQNYVDIMQVLSDAGVDIDRTSRHGATPLISAAMKGHTEAVKWLLSRGADWHMADAHGHTARDLAQQWERTEATLAIDAWILEHGSTAEMAAMKTQLNEALLQAATTGETVVLKKSLNQGADPNAADEQGWTSLFWAASTSHNDVDAMEALLAAGAKVNTTDWRGWTPLMAAVDQSCTAEWLLQHDADWRKVDREGKSALDLARERGNVEVVATLEAWAAKVPRLEEGPETA